MTGEKKNIISDTAISQNKMKKAELADLGLDVDGFINEFGLIITWIRQNQLDSKL